MRLPFFYGWVIVAVAFVTMALGVNARTAFSLLFPPILDEFGWERGVTAGAFSFGFVTSALFGPLLGRLMDRRGPRLVVLMGVGLVAAGLALAPLGHRPWHLYATLGVMVHYGTIFGTLSLASIIGGALGPWVAGALHDRTGSYTLAFTIAIAASAVSAVAIWLAAPRKVRAVAGRVHRIPARALSGST